MRKEKQKIEVVHLPPAAFEFDTRRALEEEVERILTEFSAGGQTPLTAEQVEKPLVYASSRERFATFLRVAHCCKGPEFWKLFEYAYTSGDSRYEDRKEIKKTFLSQEPGRNELMDADELAVLQSLPDRFTIYRAMTEQERDSGDFGVSWSLDKGVAEWFRDECRYRDANGLRKCVHQIEVDKSKVIAYFAGRNEKEIICIHTP